jgi:hypothetical protein
MTIKASAIALFTLILSVYSSAKPQQIIEAIQIQRNGLIHLISFMDSHEDIFARPDAYNELLNRAQKETAIEVWQLYLDYMSTLSMLADETRDYRKLSGKNRQQRKELYALAFNAHYRFGMEFIQRIKTDPELVKLLNSADNGTNLPDKFFNHFSLAFVSDWATDNYEFFNSSFRFTEDSEVYALLRADLDAIDQLNRRSILAKTSIATINYSLYSLYYPIQKTVARGMGKVKFWRINKTLITPVQALAFSHEMEPGDFYLTRKEWRLTNVGIPGFWTHSALYIGTPEERAEYFDTPEVNLWLAEKGYSSLEALLKDTSVAYASEPAYDDLGFIRVLEVLDAGAIFNSIETSLDADAAAVFRPRLSKLEKAKALVNAFYYAGRPYDFHFDFETDGALVCSELIYKAYQKDDDQQGIQFPLYHAVGKKMLTPSEMAAWYDETKGTSDQQLDLVMFIDSNEEEGIAFLSTPEAFTGTWNRSDLYVFKQPTYTGDLPKLVETESNH